MISNTIEQELHRELEHLPLREQRRVLDFARTLSTRPQGIRGKELLRFAGTLAPEDADEMLKVIEEGCGNIDHTEW